MNHGTKKLIKLALDLGPSDVRITSAQAICVEDRLAGLCEEPGCPGYGKTINCPPHVMRPEEFRECVGQFEFALVFKFDVPTEMLLTDERREIARTTHETAASIERLALHNGFERSMGLAAGSCKPLFCTDFDECLALAKGGECRFPDFARPSMSGVGINFFDLAEKLGWDAKKITSATRADDVPMGMMAGMVLIG